MRPTRLLLLTILLIPATALAQNSTQRLFTPEDLFRIRQVGAVAWSPDSNYATIEFSRPGKTLDASYSSEIALYVGRSRALVTLTPKSPEYLGFFNAVWSPTGRRLAFLSVDANAVVRAWTWAHGSATATPISGFDVRTGFSDQTMIWIDDERLALLAWDTGAVKSSTLSFRVLRGGNSAKLWRQAYEGKEASVTSVESGKTKPGEEPSGQLVVIEVNTKRSRVLARGKLHRLALSADRSQIRFLRDGGGKKTASYFEHTDVEAAYNAVNWGTELNAIDIRSGQLVAEPAPAATRTPSPNPTIAPPGSDARRLAVSPDGTAAFFTAAANDGTRVWVCGASCTELWRANEWVNEVKQGRAESLTYKAIDGTPLKAWLLLPPGHVAGTRVPVVTYVYPGSVYGDRVPGSFALLRADFEHHQLFAARGYAVLLPSMPEARMPADNSRLDLLANGVLPAVDAAVEKGFVDPNRVAVMGQSAGGFATLGLITQTTRFRSAIASASYSDLTSLYGTFYGQNRYSDSAAPHKGQLLRALQMEQGAFALGGPPWAKRELYDAGSPILQVDKVQTPVMLIHGDSDFIPIQQAEQFFTALFRQDKRASMVRYHGEWHTISARANVLDMWQRMTAWLDETMR